MVFIIGGSGFLSTFYQVWPNPWTKMLAEHMKHAGWEGFCFLDLIAPLFLFLVGLLLPTVVLGRIEKGVRLSKLYPHLLKRAAILVFLGWVNYGLLRFQWDTMRWSTVLGRIGICYFFASLLVIHTRWKTQLGISVAILLGFWAALLWIPVPGYGPGDLMVAYIDEDEVVVELADYFANPVRLTPPEALSLLASGMALMSTKQAPPALQSAVKKLQNAVIGVDDEALVVDLAEPPLVAELRNAAAAGEVVAVCCSRAAMCGPSSGIIVRHLALTSGPRDFLAARSFRASARMPPAVDIDRAAGIDYQVRRMRRDCRRTPVPVLNIFGPRSGQVSVRNLQYSHACHDLSVPARATCG